VTTVLLFFAFPSSVALLATGTSGPFEEATIFVEEIPF